MADRADLQDIFESLLGSSNVYFQPPTVMQYPCILYERDYIKTAYANNLPYSSEKRYKVTVIDKNPDSLIPEKILALPKSSFDRHFTKDNLNHDVLIVYF